MIERLLHAAALYARRRYRRIFVFLAIALVLCVLLSLRLRIDTEILNLLPQDDPVVKTFREALSEFGSLDFLLVVVRLPEDGEVLAPYLSFIDRLGPRLEALDEVEYVDYKIGEMEELVETFFPQAFLYLDEAGRAEVEQRLTDQAIRTRVREIRRALRSPQSVALRELLLLDPLGLADVFIDRLVGARGGLEVDWTRGYFLSKDRSLALMVARPTLPAQEIEFDRRLIGAVRGAISETSDEWPDLSGDESLPPPGVDLGGTYVTALEDAGHLARDIILNVVTSMVAVLLLFLFAFRRLGVIVYAFVPLASGLILALGFAAATVGLLNAITSSFAALLVGLGIDFVIVSYGRYVDERRRGARLAGALRAMCGSSGRAVVTGGVTTAGTFYAFGLTEFTGLKQMGLLIGTGILFCMVAVLVLLPALLAWSEDRHERLSRAPRRYLHGFGSAKLVAWSWHHPRSTLAIGAVLTLISALAAPRLQFVDSIRAMRPEGNRGVAVETEVGEKFGSGFDYMMLVLHAPDEAAALRLTAQVAAEAKDLIAKGELIAVEGITSLLPPYEEQEESLRWLETMRQEGLPPSRVRQSFVDAAKAEGLRADAFGPGLALIEQALAATRPVALETFGGNDSTHRLLERFLLPTHGEWRSVLYLYPPPRTWKREAPPGVEALADKWKDQAVLTGVNLVSETLRVQVRKDAVFAAIVGFLIVAALLWVDYRRFVDAALSLAPLVVGVVWMFGCMEWLGLDFNFFNIFVTTMIIGIGVDYGIHIVHRWREMQQRGEDFLSGFCETGKAIVLAALSTSVGFGSMSLSSYPGLRSMGLVAILGAVATALVSITLLPAAFKLRLGAGSDGRDRQQEPS